MGASRAVLAHAADAVVAAVPDRDLHRLTIDARASEKPRELARSASALGPDVSVAILAVDHATGEVQARVASADYFDIRRAGQVDMTLAVRSPGSTLKPFIYGLGFEDGLIHPESLIDDRAVRYGGYAPENFDLTFQGTVTVRRALQLSLNVPAVAVLDKVGSSRFTARLAQAGGTLVLPKGEVPGLAMGLGGVGVSLTDLVTLYAGLARLGTSVPLTERVADAAEPPAARRLLDPVAAWYVGSILLAPAARQRRRRRTPTRPASYGYRDAWAAGPTAAHDRRLGRPPRRCPVPGPWAAWPRRRSCPTPLRGPANPRPRCPAPKGAPIAATGSCRRCSASAPACWRARGRASHGMFRPTAPGSSLQAMPTSPIRSRSRSPAASGPSRSWSTASRCRPRRAAARCSSSRRARASCASP
jgi:penicillin-binding protein 1C